MSLWIKALDLYLQALCSSIINAIGGDRNKFTMFKLTVENHLTKRSGYLNIEQLRQPRFVKYLRVISKVLGGKTAVVNFKQDF